MGIVHLLAETALTAGDDDSSIKSSRAQIATGLLSPADSFELNSEFRIFGTCQRIAQERQALGGWSFSACA